MARALTCPSCHKTTYQDVENCPHCGTPFVGSVHDLPGSDTIPHAAGEQAFSVSACLLKTAAVVFRNFVPFVGIALLITAPVILIELVFDVPARYDALLQFINTLLSYLAMVAITYGTITDLRGHQTGIVHSLTNAAPSALSALGVGLLSGLMIMIVFVFSVMVAMTLTRAMAIPDGHPLSIVLMMVASIPGLIVFSMYWTAIPVRVVENLGIIKSLSRSKRLSEGERGKILAVFFVVFSVAMLPFFILFMTAVDDAAGALENGVTMSFQIGLYLVSAVSMVILSVAAAVTYHDLRLGKEGEGTENTAEIFE